tara:strand:- start:463 stop:1512 length:1050 start_codon:yes stop_codon:yes gene_type:complete
MTRARDLAAGTFEQATGGVLKLETSDTTVTDGSVLGKIEFKAPDEASGTDAILVGAAIEAVAEGTFAADNNATELVFKTGASAAADAKMILDSSGNLLVGKTSSSFTTEGVEVRPDALWVTRDSDTPVFLNRETNDGAILSFSKDGSTVGSIGTKNHTGFSSLYTEGVANSSGLFFANQEILPSRNSALTNGTMDLGDGNYRFKDLYLSGGVYLGGTGSANHLDDYEEGTWTPYWSSTGATFSYATQFGNYVKVGNMVHAQFYLQATASGTTSNSTEMQGFPFTAADLSPFNQWAGGAWISNDINSTLLKARNNTVAVMYKNKSGTPETLDAAELSGVYFVGSVSYRSA